MEAFKWINQAAGQEHQEAQFALGRMYERGQGVMQDRVGAIKWYSRATEQGHTGALTWIHKEAEQRLADAQYELGLMLEYGRGVRQNVKKAFN